MSATTYRGPWADTGQAAIDTALADVNVTRGEYVECQFSNGYRLVPVADDRPEIDVDVRWSETRQQYRAVLRKL